MAGPFRYNKKQRKAMRKRANAEAEAAEKLAARSSTQSAAVLQELAEMNTKMSLAKRTKNKSSK
jgi:hypothetical protein